MRHAPYGDGQAACFFLLPFRKCCSCLSVVVIVSNCLFWSFLLNWKKTLKMKNFKSWRLGQTRKEGKKYICAEISRFLSKHRSFSVSFTLASMMMSFIASFAYLAGVSYFRACFPSNLQLFREMSFHNLLSGLSNVQWKTCFQCAENDERRGRILKNTKCRM